MVTVPTETVQQHNDGVLISFPTGKSGWADLTAADQRIVTKFVTTKARAIAALHGAGIRLKP